MKIDLVAQFTTKYPANDFTIYDLLSFLEGKSLTAYNDSLGFKTIGVGHLLKANEQNITTITEQQCQDYFNEDIKSAEQSCKTLWLLDWDKATKFQKMALISLLFNIGIHKFKEYTATIHILRSNFGMKVIDGTCITKLAKQKELLPRRLLERFIFELN